MNKLNNRFFLFLLPFLTLSCSDLFLEGIEDGNSIDFINSNPDLYWVQTNGEKNILRRAYQLSKIQWIPLLAIPNNIGCFSANETVLGIPYSSTKELNKCVGFDVSFHTFMTAVHNPYSVLYTENIGEKPYHGKNCACYYGTVCSAAVAYALDLAYPVTSYDFPNVIGISEVEFRSIDKLMPCDILQRPGHVFMIVKLEKDKYGNVEKVAIFESAGTTTYIKIITADSLLKRINTEQLHVLRYGFKDKVQYHPIPFVSVDNGVAVPFSYNDSLCPNKGDRSVYRSDEPVIIDVFDTNYTTLNLERDNKGVISYKVDNHVVDIGQIDPGKYRVYLKKDGMESERVDLIVANPIVKIEANDRVRISFSCDEGEPLYCIISNINGESKHTHILTDEEINKGYAILDTPNGGPYYYKVVFNTEFGTVTNMPIAV